MSKKIDLIKRLQHFQQHQVKAGDRYGAELLHHTIAALADLEAKLTDLGGYVSAQTGQRVNVSYSDLWDKNKLLEAALQDTIHSLDCIRTLSKDEYSRLEAQAALDTLVDKA